MYVKVRKLVCKREREIERDQVSNTSDDMDLLRKHILAVLYPKFDFFFSGVMHSECDS